MLPITLKEIAEGFLLPKAFESISYLAFEKRCVYIFGNFLYDRKVAFREQAVAHFLHLCNLINVSQASSKVLKLMCGKPVKVCTFISTFFRGNAQIQLSIVYSRPLSCFHGRVKSDITSLIELPTFQFPLPPPFLSVFQWKRVASQQRLPKLLVFRKRKYLRSIPLTLWGEKVAKIPLTTGLLNVTPGRMSTCLRNGCIPVSWQKIFRYNWCIQY